MKSKANQFLITTNNAKHCQCSYGINKVYLSTMKLCQPHNNRLYL